PPAITSQFDIPPCWMKASNRPFATYARPSADEPIEREIRICFRIARARLTTARPPSAIWTTKSDSLSLSEAVIGSPLSVAGPSAAAANGSLRVGPRTTPTDGRPSTARPIDTQKNGIPFAWLIVPATGSLLQTQPPAATGAS